MEVCGSIKEGLLDWRGERIIKSFAGAKIELIDGSLAEAEDLNGLARWGEAGRMYYGLLRADLPTATLLRIIDQGPQMLTNAGKLAEASAFLTTASHLAQEIPAGRDFNAAQAVLHVRKGWIFDNLQLFRKAMHQFELSRDWLKHLSPEEMNKLELETCATAVHFLHRQQEFLSLLGVDPLNNATNAHAGFRNHEELLPLLESKGGGDQTQSLAFDAMHQAVCCAVLAREHKRRGNCEVHNANIAEGRTHAQTAFDSFERLAAGDPWNGGRAHGRMIRGAYYLLDGDRLQARRNFAEALEIRQHGLDTGRGAYPFGYVDAALGLTRVDLSEKKILSVANHLKMAVRMSPQYTIGKAVLFGLGIV